MVFGADSFFNMGQPWPLLFIFHCKAFHNNDPQTGHSIKTFLHRWQVVLAFRAFLILVLKRFSTWQLIVWNQMALLVDWTFLFVKLGIKAKVIELKLLWKTSLLCHKLARLAVTLVTSQVLVYRSRRLFLWSVVLLHPLTHSPSWNTYILQQA